MSKYLLIDDETKARAVIKKLITDIDNTVEIVEADSVTNGVIQYINEKPDLVFLDIEMPHKNGFEFIHELALINETPKVVFVTAFNQYAIQAIKASALDYLLKPINPTDLQLCINKISSLFEAENNAVNISTLLKQLNIVTRIKINTRTGFEILNPTDIVYCKADSNYTAIYLNNNSIHTTSTNLGKIIDQLPNDEFFRVSRSLIINIKFLTSVNRKEKCCIINHNGNEIELPITNSRIQELSEIF